MTTQGGTNAGGMHTFNIQHGFPEALVRGMRSSFMADSDYHHLTQCETLDDVRLNMTETDYSESVADMQTLTPSGLQDISVNKVRREETQRCGLKTVPWKENGCFSVAVALRNPVVVCHWVAVRYKFYASYGSDGPISKQTLTFERRWRRLHELHAAYLIR